MIRRTIAKLLAGVIGVVGAMEVWIAATFAIDGIARSEMGIMVPLFFVFGLCQIAVCAFVLLQYSHTSVRLLSAAIGMWGFALAGNALDRNHTSMVGTDNIAWMNVLAILPVLAGICVYKGFLWSLTHDADPIKTGDQE